MHFMVQQKKCLVLTHTVYERWTHPALPRWFMDAFSILAAVIILFFFFQISFSLFVSFKFNSALCFSCLSVPLTVPLSSLPLPWL